MCSLDEALVEEVSCDLLYLEFYTTCYNVPLEDTSTEYELDQIRDFEESDHVRETNRLLCECKGMRKKLNSVEFFYN